MKKILIVLFIAVMVLIIPTPKQMDDETSLHLDALLYDVYLVNRWDPDMPVYEYDEDGNKKYSGTGQYISGIVVVILDNEVFNNTNPHIEVHE